jgi:hypothetical protein
MREDDSTRAIDGFNFISQKYASPVTVNSPPWRVPWLNGHRQARFLSLVTAVPQGSLALLSMMHLR